MTEPAPAQAAPPKPAGPPPEQLEATLRWVTSVFADHYETAPPPMPPRFARREFGFLWNGAKGFHRHISFGSPDAFERYMASQAPHHAYYSTAYYRTPHASTMKEKEWLGADLIFDLDADHLPNADKMSFADQLAEVKRQARKLLHDFLLGDFGFDADHVRIVFSGGRGYHFHVTDPRVLMLDSAARREIVDYLSPNDIVADAIRGAWLKDRTLHDGPFPKKVKTIPPATAGGWAGRQTSALADYLEDLLALPREDAIARLCEFDGIGRSKAEAALDDIDARFIASLRSGADWLHDDAERIELPKGLQQKALVDGLVQRMVGLAEGETDEPVTADIKRLIRLPGSLHGKTGLRVTPMTIDEFERFDPLRDAVALGDEPARIVVSKPTVVPLKGRELRVEPGEQELPLYAAMFVTLRRAALVPMRAG